MSGPELPANARAAWELARDPRQPWFTRLAATEELRTQLRRFEPKLAAACRAEGKTWAEIGEAVGISKQAAHERYGIS